jgi:hypothetical protein
VAQLTQAHHGQPHGQAGRISWRREKKGRFHESSWPLGGRLWAVVGARRDPRVWLALGRAEALSRVSGKTPGDNMQI